MNEITNPLTAYLDLMPDERRVVIQKLRHIINENLPRDFEEQVSDMIHYVVPLSIHLPNNSDENAPLKLMSLASQKNFVGIYHPGMQTDTKLKSWFMNEYHKYARRKLNMSNGWIRFTAMDDIPYTLVGRLAAKMSVVKWIRFYDNNVKKK